jgi:hypothetical protein
MSKWVKYIMMGAVLTAMVGATGCKRTNRVALRDAETYKNEVYFLQMAIEQNSELLAAHIADGSCSCDEDGAWNNEVCETSAFNVLVMSKRLDWHVAMMMYLAGIQDVNPGEEPPVDPAEISEYCPE